MVTETFNAVYDKFFGGWIEEENLGEAGAKLLIGTEPPNPFVVPGFSVLEELENFVAAGFTPMPAMAAATRYPALFFNEQDQWGTLEEGRRADLILLNADPLENISNRRHRPGVMVRGRWFPETQLKSMPEEMTIQLK